MGDIWRSKANKRKFRRALSFKAIVRNLRFLSAERFHHFGYFYNRERGTEKQRHRENVTFCCITPLVSDFSHIF